ncbi:hypothetical protein CJA_0562 [Cellvibrio japonicus Ueda107]|uniref:Uncharacterized protein n=1 Tax=Cellvibrio japonicus (strain Ueda107) TaxID=498211 RepID=B3PJ51_CELJU|nr:hypothetical protein CJA_0562 [Cellvibrio japonicus Ueda107]
MPSNIAAFAYPSYPIQACTLAQNLIGSDKALKLHALCNLFID